VSGLGSVPVRIRALAGAVLERVQDWLAADGLGDARLVVVTRGGVETGAGEGADVVQAAVLGLLRSAQSEHPGRFVLVDADPDAGFGAAAKTAIAASSGAGPEACADAGVAGVGPDPVVAGVPAGVLRAVAVSGEPEVAVRDGRVLVPRLGRAVPAGDAQVWPVSGSVLVTGGTGLIGAVVARHLVAVHGVRDLVLASRRGAAAPGAGLLAAELEGLGARVRVAACDVGDRGALAALVESVEDLRAVVHAAAVLDDGVITALDAGRLGTVLGPKADAAWYLHELTEDLDLDAFVLFSSAAGVLGAAGQGNYAAANSVLDALAAQRRALGLPGASLAWGFWAEASGLTGALDQADRGRLSRGGVLPMSSGEGLALLDAALAARQPCVLPARLDLRRLQAGGDVPALLRGLVRAPARRPGAGPAGPSLRDQLASLPAAERLEAVTETVRGQAATVLGHSAAADVPQAQSFSALGFDSLTAVELRNRLSRLAGVRLPATLVFDYPTPEKLSAYLLECLAPAPGHGEPGMAAIDQLEAMLADAWENAEITKFTTRLESVLGRWKERSDSLAQATSADITDSAADFDQATDDELMKYIDDELGLT